MGSSAIGWIMTFQVFLIQQLLMWKSKLLKSYEMDLSFSKAFPGVGFKKVTNIWPILSRPAGGLIFGHCMGMNRTRKFPVVR